MSSPSSLTGLKCLQWLFRGIEFGCSIVVLGVNSYYLATLMKHSLPIPANVIAVESISGVGTLYTLLGLVLICGCAGRPAPSFISMVFDIGLAAAFVYVAVANRSGAASCTDGTVDTVYGSGDAGASAGEDLPTFQAACLLTRACLIVSCIASFFFLLSIPLEIKMNRTRYRLSRPIRDADGELITKSDHYGAVGAPPQRWHDFGRRGVAGRRAAPVAHPDQLPAHQQFADIQERQVEVPAWGDVSSLHDSDRLYFNDGASRDEHGPPPPVRMTSTTAPRPAAGVYNEGVVDDVIVNDVEYGQPIESEHGTSHAETGRNHRENKAARLDRLQAS